MEGGGGEARGVVPRAAEQVFGSARELSLLGWSFEFAASFMEIYNDELRDLLPAEGASGSTAPSKLKISDANGVVTVPGLRSARVENTQQLESLMTAASKVRSVAATKCNEHSSRSHYIFRLRLVGTNSKSGDTTEGELNLIDLAGSERTYNLQSIKARSATAQMACQSAPPIPLLISILILRVHPPYRHTRLRKESGVTGTAMTEANAINKSLSSLGDVISAMSSNAKHVPFRNSKLTHVVRRSQLSTPSTCGGVDRVARVDL